MTGLVGVMDGHASDLRTGLPWQMVEIHEPVRILFVVETTPERLNKVITASPSLTSSSRTAGFASPLSIPASGRCACPPGSGFEEFDGPLERLPVALSSAEWYRGQNRASPHGMDSDRSTGRPRGVSLFAVTWSL